MTDKAYTVEEVVECAKHIRTVVSIDIQQPTVHDFLSRYLTCTGWRPESVHLCEYLLCLAVLSYSLLQHPPQVVATATIVLAHHALEQRPLRSPQRNFAPDWNRRLLLAAEVNTRTDHVTDLISCAQKLANIHTSVYSRTSALDFGLRGHRGFGKLSAPLIYSRKEYLCVAKIPPTRPPLIGAPLAPSTATGSDDVGVSYKSKLLAHSLDWTLHGSKRRRCS